jgi:hypothetical protein
MGVAAMKSRMGCDMDQESGRVEGARKSKSNWCSFSKNQHDLVQDIVACLRINKEA